MVHFSIFLLAAVIFSPKGEFQPAEDGIPVLPSSACSSQQGAAVPACLQVCQGQGNKNSLQTVSFQLVFVLKKEPECSKHCK